MITKLQIEDVQDAQRVLTIQILSYTVEAELIGFFEIPPLAYEFVIGKQPL